MPKYGWGMWGESKAVVIGMQHMTIATKPVQMYSIHGITHLPQHHQCDTYCFLRHCIGQTLLALKLCVIFRSPWIQSCKVVKLLVYYQ